MRTTVFTFVIVAIIAVLSLAAPAHGAGRILYIDSYHEGYAWSDGILRGIQSVLSDTDIQLQIFRMDTKRNKNKNFIRKAAVQAKMEIERLKPNVVIASDDNAARYLIKPFYKDADQPIVFCGINWDASMYGFPYKNVTGMIEVAFVPKLLEKLKPYAKGEKIGYLAADVTTARKEGTYMRKLFNLDIEERYAGNFSDWVKLYNTIQDTMDMVIVGNKAGIADWDPSRAREIVETKTRVPTGTLYDFMPDYALVAFTKIPEEQGEWAAGTALKIIEGADIATIPMTRNKRGNIIINRKIEKQLGITFPEDLIVSATRIIE